MTYFTLKMSFVFGFPSIWHAQYRGHVLMLWQLNQVGQLFVAAMTCALYTDYAEVGLS